MSSLGIPVSVWLFWALYLPSLVVGLWKGGMPERIGAGILVVMPVMQFGWYVAVPARYDAIDPVSVVVDLVGILGFGFLALNARRFWPILACALQLLSFAAHFARSVELSGNPVVYAWMKSTPTLAAALCVLAGTISYRMRANRPGAMEPWVDWASLTTSKRGQSRY